MHCKGYGATFDVLWDEVSLVVHVLRQASSRIGYHLGGVGRPPRVIVEEVFAGVREPDEALGDVGEATAVGPVGLPLVPHLTKPTLIKLG